MTVLNVCFMYTSEVCQLVLGSAYGSCPSLTSTIVFSCRFLIVFNTWKIRRHEWQDLCIDQDTNTREL